MKTTYIIIVFIIAFTLHSCGVYYEPRGDGYYPRQRYATVHYAPRYYGVHHYGGGHYGGGHGGMHFGGGRR